jgi:hydrogenase expression/formation protein HypE
MFLKVGKLSVDMLKKCIFSNIGIKRPEVLVHSKIGEDCSVVQFGDNCCVLSTDPITGARSSIGKLSVHISCNDIASCGVEPLGILVTILVPRCCSEDDILSLMNEINDAATSINVEILGGHTEVTDAVNKIVISTTAVGKGPVGRFVTSSGAEAGDYIIVTKYAGLEGTSIIASDYEDYLKGKLGEDIVNEAKKYINMISVVKEGIIGGKMGAKSMHDATEGGLLGALWEVAEASGVGFEIDEHDIPVTYETKAICSAVKIDPLKLISSGMMVMTSKCKDALIKSLKGQGINASCIGKIIGDAKRRVLVSKGCEKEVLPPQADELFNIKIH